MKNTARSYPNLFLLGAPKSGTTFIFDLLRNSTDVFTSHRKEPAYFLVYGQKIKYKKRLVTPLPSSSDEAEYCALYEGATENHVIDASTHYLSSPETAARIHAVCPNAKVVAVLREPISRAYSHFLMGRRDGFVVEDFPEALALEQREMEQPDIVWSEHYRFIRRSLYLDGMKAFHALFGSNMRVYLFSDIKTDPNFIIDDLCDFLGLSSDELTEKIEEAERNPFAVDRFSALTRVIQRYRESELRHLVNRLTPAKLRIWLRTSYDKARLKESAKPKLDDKAREMLEAALGDDFEAALNYGEDVGILKRAPTVGT